MERNFSFPPISSHVNGNNLYYQLSYFFYPRIFAELFRRNLHRPSPVCLLHTKGKCRCAGTVLVCYSCEESLFYFAACWKNQSEVFNIQKKRRCVRGGGGTSRCHCLATPWVWKKRKNRKMAGGGGLTYWDLRIIKWRAPTKLFTY